MVELLILILLLLGAVGVYTQYVLIAAILSLGVVVVVKKYTLPNFLGWYLLFLVVCSVSLFWSKNVTNSVPYILLFVSGAMFWIVSKNFKIEIKKIILLLLMLLTLGFFMQQKWGILVNNYLSLLTPATIDHAHVGDLWAVGILVILNGIILGKKLDLWSLLCGIVGVVVIYVSGSRTAVLSLMVGIILLVANKILTHKQQIFVVVAIFLMTTIFLVFGMTKSVVFSRPYLLQSLLGFSSYPFGVGLGNFEIISSEFSTGWGTFSTVAHNIFAELLSGIGILSVIFIIWLIKIFSIIRRLPDINKILVVVLGIQFMFDYVYLIPLFYWLFFVLLGSTNDNLD
jgi:hypothetical protein